MIRMELLAQKKGEQIVNELKAKNLTSIDAYAQAMGSRIDTVKYITMNTPRISGIGMEPVLNAGVAYAAQNELAGPMAGNNGVYVFKVYNRTKENVTYDEKEQMRSLEENMGPRVGYFAIQKLMEEAEVKDNRIRFE